MCKVYQINCSDAIVRVIITLSAFSQDGSTYFPEVVRTVPSLRQACGNKKLQICQAQCLPVCPEGDSGQEHKCHPNSKRISQSAVSEQSYPRMSCFSRVPLKVRHQDVVASFIKITSTLYAACKHRNACHLS